MLANTFREATIFAFNGGYHLCLQGRLPSLPSREATILPLREATILPSREATMHCHAVGKRPILPSVGRQPALYW